MGTAATAMRATRAQCTVTTAWHRRTGIASLALLDLACLTLALVAASAAQIAPAGSAPSILHLVVPCLQARYASTRCTAERDAAGVLILRFAHARMTGELPSHSAISCPGHPGAMRAIVGPRSRTYSSLQLHRCHLPAQRHPARLRGHRKTHRCHRQRSQPRRRQHHRHHRPGSKGS